MQIVNPKDMSFTYANMKQGRIGDILRLKKSTDSKSSHSVVFLSCDKNGMKVLDCNWPDSNGKCNSGVQIHVIPWNNYKQATISRAKNYDITQTVYQVTYNVNGGNESSCPAAQVKKQGEVLTLTSSKPTRNGAEFLGWSTQEWPQNVEYAAGAKYTKDADVKLHAVWKFAPGTYKVDGTIGSAYFRAEADPTSKMLGNIPEGTQFKISKFDGNWGYIKYNGNWGYVSMRYTALISLAKYTFVYHANSGKGTMPQQTITYGQKFTLAANSFTRDGYGFVGWTIKRYSDNTWISEGHGWMTEDKLSNAGYEKRIYPDSATKIFDTSWTKGYDGVSNYDLYAVWEKISAPATVTLGTAKAGANGIKVTWTQTEGAVKYNVYRRTADTKWTSTPLATVSGTSFTDKTVKAGETYIYTVRGIASDGKSLSTGYDKNGVTATALPATVTLGTAKAGANGIKVTWSKAEGAVRYRVYRQAAGESSWTTLTSSATGTSYTDKKAKAGVTYTYTVRALNSANGLSAGYDKNGVKAIIAPATVTLGTAKAGANGITVTWAKADGAVKYNVYRRTADTKWTSAPLATVSGTSFTDKTAKAGVKYIYTVRGVASDGKTLSTGYDKTGVTATALPATVKLGTAKAGANGIKVTWSKAEGAVKYRVYRKSAGTDWTTLTSSATGTSYTDRTVKAGVKYTYTVRALNSVNRLSGGYDKNGVSAVIAPAKVVLVSARADSAGILVTWKAASGAHTYQVYRKTASDGWKLVAKNISDTEWKDTSAVKGTTYTYTVRAVADDGTTRGACDTRGKSAAVTKASTTPANVTIGKATAGKKGITVTWSYAAEAKTYNVYRQVAGEKTWTAVAKNVNGKSWTDTKVTKGTKYTYMVRGVSANGKALSRSYTATVSATAK